MYAVVDGEVACNVGNCVKCMIRSPFVGCITVFGVCVKCPLSQKPRLVDVVGVHDSVTETNAMLVDCWFLLRIFLSILPSVCVKNRIHLSGRLGDEFPQLLLIELVFAEVSKCKYLGNIEIFAFLFEDTVSLFGRSPSFGHHTPSIAWTEGTLAVQY